MLFRNKSELKKIKNLPYLSIKYIFNNNNNNNNNNNSLFFNYQKFKFSEKSNPIDSDNFKLNLDGKDFSNFNEFYEKMKINIDAIIKFNTKT